MMTRTSILKSILGYQGPHDGIFVTINSAGAGISKASAGEGNDDVRVLLYEQETESGRREYRYRISVTGGSFYDLEEARILNRCIGMALAIAGTLEEQGIKGWKSEAQQYKKDD